ncbi:nucleotidyltransferase family protein [cf. Phormidesmis sp. LEGE 11477]|uniref:nucleotidyltransferase domain-containing protein n=1 Tax=cf. Phormidesmis sp. LEGE 11477 TaxID=1828680 RepID=UPI00187E54A4|nr:nucleotidyltransferase family protein [cf. Phormidesmis sp. LEGE 11477]
MSSYPLSLSALIPNFRPEAALLLACIRPDQNEETRAEIQHLASGASSPIDWYYLLHTAEKHRVIPSLYRNLSSAQIATIPTEIYQDFRRRFFKNAQRNLRLTQELLHLLDFFEAQTISAIPYKGMILAASAYGKISLRQVWDIDFLVHEKDVVKSRTALIADGFRVTESFDREQSFFHDEREVEVDLHWGVTPFYFPVNLSFDRLWNNRQKISLNATSIKSFSNEDLLLILCIQIAKDCWERRQHIENLAKVCDIASLIYTAKDLNWDKVLSQANELNIHRIVLFGLCLAHSLLEADLPEQIIFQIQDTPTLTALSKQVCRHLFGEYDEDFSDPRTRYSDIRARTRQLIFYFRLRERRAERFQHVYQIIKTIPEILSS